MPKKKKKIKTKRATQGIRLEKIPYKITNFYKEYKKQKEIEESKLIYCAIIEELTSP